MFKNRLFLALFIALAVLVSSCGKKDESKKEEPKKDDKKTTTQTDTKKPELKKSTEPKKKETPTIPAGWIDITSPDGKLVFKMPENWTAKSENEKGHDAFTAESPDKSMGLVAIAFPNADVTSDGLLAAQLQEFKFDPDGDAIPVETDNVDGWLVVAKSNLDSSPTMMYMMSMIDKDGPGNYVIYIFTDPAKFAASKETMENILFSVDIKK